VEKVCVIGLSYVGLPTTVVFVSRGYSVVGVDVDVRKVEAVNSGKCCIREPGLDDLLRRLFLGVLRVTTDAVEAVRKSDVAIITVPTC